MKICIDRILKTLTGKDLDSPQEQGEDNGKSESLTLRVVITNALLAPTEENNKLSGQKKLDAWNLAQKVNSCNADGSEALSICELSAEEISACKEAIGKAWPIIISGQAWEMLEKTAEPAVEKPSEATCEKQE